MIVGPSLLLAALLAAAPPSAAPQGPDTLTIDEAVRRALGTDPTVAAAEADRDAASARLRVARAAWLPSLLSSAQAVRFEEPMVVAPIHAFDIANAPEFDRVLVQARAELSYTLWDGGARGARIEGARATRAAGDASARSARQETTARVVDAYLGALTARDVLGAQAARREELVAERDRVARFLEQGAAAPVELLRAEAELSAAAADESAARARLDLADQALARLLDLPVAEIAGRPLADVALAEEAPPADVDRALDDHPLLAAAQGRVLAARAAVRQARAAWLPSLHANGALVEYGGGSADYQGEWQAGLRMEYPLFTGGARSGASQRAAAEVRSAEASLERLRRQLLDGADGARTAEEEARGRVSALATAVSQFEELSRVEALSLEEGVGVQRDFLRAQSGLLEARTGLAEARRALVRARVRLALALGLLTPDWIDRSLEPAS